MKKKRGFVSSLKRLAVAGLVGGGVLFGGAKFAQEQYVLPKITREINSPDRYLDYKKAIEEMASRKMADKNNPL